MLELMATVAVVAIVSVFAVPAMSDFIGRNKISTEVNRLVGDLLLARNTAITRGTFVTLCRSSDQSVCLAGAANRFDAGWMTYVSPNTRIAFNSGVAGNDLLKVGQIASPQIEMRTIGGSAPDFITYLASGRVDPVGGTGNIVITVCAGGQSTVAVPGRRLTLSVSGRPSVSKMGVGACTA